MKAILRPLICVSVWAVLALPGTGAVSVYEDFEDEALVLGAEEACCSHSFTRTAEIKKAGAYGGRFEVRKGDRMVHKGSRAEFRRNLSLPEREAWSGFSVYPDPSLKDRHYVRFMQYWSGRSGHSGMVTMGFIPNARIAIECRWSANQSSDSKGFTAAYKPGAWNDIVVHVVWPKTEGGSGLIQLWVNSVKAIDYQPKGTMGGLPSTHKFGLYSSEGDWGDYANEVAKVSGWAVFDEIRFGGASTNYDQVKPGSASKPTAIRLEPTYGTARTGAQPVIVWSGTRVDLKPDARLMGYDGRTIRKWALATHALHMNRRFK